MHKISMVCNTQVYSNHRRFMYKISMVCNTQVYSNPKSSFDLKNLNQLYFVRYHVRGDSARRKADYYIVYTLMKL